MIDENTLRLFALTLWAVGMFFFVVWAAIIALREVFIELRKNRLICFWEGEIERFLATRRYQKQRREFLRWIAENEKEMLRLKDKGAE